METNKPLYRKSPEEALQLLETSLEGLKETQAIERQEVHGKNALREEKKVSLLQKFLNQFKDFMIIILIVASIISGLVGEVSDTIIILIVVLLNAVVGVLQEYKAEKALDALNKMSLPYAKVRRDNKVQSIKSEDLVPGDVVLLDAGDFVPADLRLLTASSLKIEEAALTGESVPAEKSVDLIDEDNIVLNDMKNMAFSGSYVVYGRGEGVVASIGMETEVGKIASLIMSSESEDTPLQKNIQKTGKLITIGILLIALITFFVGIMNGKEIIEMFMISISLAVAAIPEGLPAIITIVLAIGVQKMAKENAIIRKLSAVETLGCTEIICTDKTGTLTQNRMTVREVYLNEMLHEAGAFKLDVEMDDHPHKSFITQLVLCNDSRLSVEDGVPNIIGDPTENALVHFGQGIGFDKNHLEAEFPREFDIPFDSERKMMTVVSQSRAIVKGAPDVLITKCHSIEVNGEMRPMTDKDIENITRANKTMADKALRVLALAYKPVEKDNHPLHNKEMNAFELEESLTFMGLVGMIDPPREEVKGAIRHCKQAGIRTVMITGDHKDTAFAIAKELGITDDESRVITGSELNLIEADAFDHLVERFSVYARVSPEHKLRIVRAWKKKGKIVAMTGDGVNDAPALKVADIGIGMGITGTDVTKSVSNMVLADDNFATIVVAVEEGRHIYANITKAIQFLLACNLGEVLVVFLSTLMGQTALYPIQLLWINLVTDTLPALALGVDKTKVSVMNDKPRNASNSIFSNGVGISMVYQGILEGAITLGVYVYALNVYSNAVAITMAFMNLGLIQLAHALNVRSNKESLFKLGFFANKYLNGAIVISVLFQVATVLIQPLNKVFKVVPLNLEQWSIVGGAAISIIVFVELIKIGIRSFSAKTK